MNKDIDNPAIKYVYQLPYHSLWGIGEKDVMLYIVDEDFKEQPEEGCYIQLPEWFAMVDECHILPWICACLNKKYVKKEYVKLLMATDPLKIRMRTNAMLQTTPDTIEDRQLVAVFLTLYDQILENHKIINFNSPQKVATQTAFIKEGNYLNWLLDGPAKRVLNMTDGVWKKYEDKCKEERIQQIINKAQAKAKETEEPQMDNND